MSVLSKLALSESVLAAAPPLYCPVPKQVSGMYFDMSDVISLLDASLRWQVVLATEASASPPASSRNTRQQLKMFSKSIKCGVHSF